MAEIIKRFRAFGADMTLWRSKDAEGRMAYAATRNRNGVAIEPKGGWRYNQRLARLANDPGKSKEAR